MGEDYIVSERMLLVNWGVHRGHRPVITRVFEYFHKVAY